MCGGGGERIPGSSWSIQSSFWPTPGLKRKRELRKALNSQQQGPKKISSLTPSWGHINTQSTPSEALKKSLYSHNFPNMDYQVFLCCLNTRQNWLWNCNDSCHVQILLKNIKKNSHLVFYRTKGKAQRQRQEHRETPYLVLVLSSSIPELTTVTTDRYCINLIKTSGNYAVSTRNFIVSYKFDLPGNHYSSVSKNAQYDIRCNTFQRTFFFRVLES